MTNNPTKEHVSCSCLGFAEKSIHETKFLLLLTFGLTRLTSRVRLRKDSCTPMTVRANSSILWTAQRLKFSQQNCDPRHDGLADIRTCASKLGV